MVTIFLHRNGQTEPARSIDRAWLNPASKSFVWVDLGAPSIPEMLILSDTFAFHPLAVEDARAELHYPKVEAYDGYLYAILHGILFNPQEHVFATHDIDFFVGPNYLVTVHQQHSRSIATLQENVVRNAKLMSEGPVALFHRIVDQMVDHYAPEIEQFEERLERIESDVFERPSPELLREILQQKRRVGELRRIISPQRDAIARLARREFIDISTDMSFRFRDVYDHLMRFVDDVVLFQDRIAAVLDAHLTNVSNRLNEVMKVLTVVSTILLPLTLFSGIYGMNIALPHFPGGDADQFWWIIGIMTAVVATLLAILRRLRWI